MTSKIPLSVSLSIYRDSFLTIYALVLYAVWGNYLSYLSLHTFSKSAIPNQSVLFRPHAFHGNTFHREIIFTVYSVISLLSFIELSFHPHPRLPYPSLALANKHMVGPMTTSSNTHILSVAWTSYQIRKIAGCACAGNARIVFPATGFKCTCHDACQDR